MEKDRICVYTCITGNYDNLEEVEKEDGLDYYCFTNNHNITSNTWNIIYIEDDILTNVELARKIKIQGHPIINEYDILVWIDGSVKFKKSIKEFVKTFLNKKDIFAAFKHSERNSIQEECYECMRKRKEKKEKIKKLLNFYKKNDYKFDNGLIESTVYIKRPKNKLVQKTMDLWFNMIINYSHRDQLSFNYCISKTKMPIHWIDLKVFDNDWFNCNLHGNEKSISSYRVYFDNKEEYNIDYDFSDKFELKDNKYYINIKVPITTEKTVVELSKISYIELKNIKVNNINDLKIHYFNGRKLNNRIIFLNENPAFEFYNKLEKGSKLHIELEMNLLTERDIINILNNELHSLETDNSKLQEVNNDYKNKLEYEKEQNKNINEQINEIKNRKIWKLVNYYDKIHR